LATLAAPLLVQAEEAKEQQIHDKPAVRGSIMPTCCRITTTPFTLYPYETNYVLYTDNQQYQ
jgi:phospholipase A1/A2